MFLQGARFIKVNSSVNSGLTELPFTKKLTAAAKVFLNLDDFIGV
jgi:hypothetical protein